MCLHKGLTEQKRQGIRLQERQDMEVAGETEHSEMLRQREIPRMTENRNAEIGNLPVSETNLPEHVVDERTRFRLGGENPYADETNTLRMCSEQRGVLSAGSIFYRGDNRTLEELTDGFVPQGMSNPDGGEILDSLTSAKMRIKNIKENWSVSEYVHFWIYPTERKRHLEMLRRTDIPLEELQKMERRVENDITAGHRTGAGVALSVSGWGQSGAHNYRVTIGLDMHVIEKIEDKGAFIYFYGDRENIDESTALAMHLGFKNGTIAEFDFLTAIPADWIRLADIGTEDAKG